MATIGNLIINIAANTAALEQGVSKSGRLLNDLNRTVGSLGLGTIGAGAAVAGLTKFMSDSISAAQEAERIQADLNATLESTQHAAGLSAGEINNLAEKLSSMTRFEDDAIVQGEAMLLTFTNIGSDVFPQASEAMLNLTEKFGSMDSASVMLGKALNDPVLGIGALRRVGIQMSTEQEEQIKKFVELGDVASAQKVILGELERQFGGLAVAMGETTSGKAERLNNAFGNMQEAIGAGVLPVLDSLLTKIEGLTGPLTANNEQLTLMVEYVSQVAASPLGAVLDNVAASMTVLETISGAVNAVLEALGLKVDETEQGFSLWGAAIQAVGEFLRVLTGGPIVWITTALQGIIDLINQIVSLSPAQILEDLGSLGDWLNGVLGGGTTSTSGNGVLGFATGGVVPGAVGGPPQLAMVHPGEVIIPAGQSTAAATVDRQVVHIQTLIMNGVQNASAFLAQLEALG